MTRLKRAYNRINKAYFGGKLPPDIEVKWHHYPKGAGICGESDSDEIWINIAHKSWGKIWEITLIHEMAHISTHEERAHHGPKWVKEIRKLFKEGAYDGLL